MYIPGLDGDVQLAAGGVPPPRARALNGPLVSAAMTAAQHHAQRCEQQHREAAGLRCPHDRTAAATAALARAGAAA